MTDDLDPKTHTEYSGPVGHEKRIHKNHFEGVERTWKSTPATWVEIGPGRYRLVPKKARKERRKTEDET